MPRCEDYEFRTVLVELLKNQDTGYIPIATPYQALDLQPQIQNSLNTPYLAGSLKNRTLPRGSPWHTPQFHLHLAWTLRKLEDVSCLSQYRIARESHPGPQN